MIVLDPSAFPKKGSHSCGVARQWCGRLGKKENCQLGVFLAYVSATGHAPLDRRLYLPKEWADDPARREACHVPEGVAYRKTWEIAHDLLRRSGPDVPHGWVVGDDEFGRASAFRECLRTDKERYILDVPCHTTVRDLDGRRPPRRKGKTGPKRKVPFVRVDSWARKLPADRWTRLTVRDGAKGPLQVEAVTARVCAKLRRRIGPEERLLVIRTVGPQPEWTYCLSNAPPDEPLAELVRVRSCRHRIEEVFPQAKGEVGLAHYEVRSWVGWHHHVTLALLALWFLVLERQRLGGKTPAVTVAQMRAIFTELLRKRPPTASEIAGRSVVSCGVTRKAHRPLVLQDQDVSAPTAPAGVQLTVTVERRSATVINRFSEVRA